ncbi:DUF5325 family protein [Lysinibacillus sp. LZ02]|uniref:DUF5325 family protein n=1 Tax=Lysinibacillus sp. LZ02 TaxID=3420668 RepID=UPI003D3656CD
MNKAKFVMFIYALAAMLSMIGIGFSVSLVFMAGTDAYDTAGMIGIIACIIATCVVFIMGMKQKKKFVQAGLL